MSSSEKVSPKRFQNCTNRFFQKKYTFIKQTTVFEYFTNSFIISETLLIDMPNILDSQTPQSQPSSSSSENHLEVHPPEHHSTLARLKLTAKHRKIYFWIGVSLCLLAPTILALIIFHHSLTIRHVESIPLLIGGYCAIAATLLSMFQIMEHLITFTQPKMQCKIIRILLMVPVYALMSWMSCIFRTAAPYFALFRDMYESYALYNFFLLMLALLGGRAQLGRVLERTTEGSTIEHFYPMNRYLRPIQLNASFVKNSHFCVFQFMLLKPLCAFLVLVLVVRAKCLGETYTFSLRNRSYLWITVITNISVSIAFTALVYFYRATKHLLKGHSPLGKFLCIKLVLFASFWQGIFIELLHVCNVLPQSAYWTKKEVANGLQDFCICIEMLLVAYGHKFCFGSQNYTPKVGGKKEGKQAKRKSIGEYEEISSGGEHHADEGVQSTHRTPMENLWYTACHRDVWER